MGPEPALQWGDQVFGDLAAPTGSCWRLGGHGVVCKAMLHSWEAGQRKKRRGDPQVGLPGAPALPCTFLRCTHVPLLDLPSPHPLQELRPPRRVEAQGPVPASVGEDVLCTRKLWRSC